MNHLNGVARCLFLLLGITGNNGFTNPCKKNTYMYYALLCFMLYAFWLADLLCFRRDNLKLLAVRTCCRRVLPSQVSGLCRDLKDIVRFVRIKLSSDSSLRKSQLAMAHLGFVRTSRVQNLLDLKPGVIFDFYFDLSIMEGYFSEFL